MPEGILTDADARPRAVQAGTSRARPLAAAARTIIERRFAREECSTGAIAERLGVNPSTLCRAYRAAYGRTIGEEIRRWRVALACRLIRDNPQRLLKQVAAEAGFRHAAYRTFLNAFRQETGMSPRQYRQIVVAAGRARAGRRGRATG